MPRPVANLCLAFLVLSPQAVAAATYQIDFSVLGANGITATFTAPSGGGVVSDLTVAFPEAVFDTQIGGGAFEYDPLAEDFVNYTGFPSYTNSVASTICGVGACFLELYPLPFDPEPGDYLAIDAELNNIDDGTKYAILPIVPPVPLPAAFPLFALALGGLAAVGFARRRT